MTTRALVKNSSRGHGAARASLLDGATLTETTAGGHRIRLIALAEPATYLGEPTDRTSVTHDPARVVVSMPRTGVAAVRLAVVPDDHAGREGVAR